MAPRDTDSDPFAQTAGAPEPALAATLTSAGSAAPASAPDAGLIGRHLAHFRIDSLLGKGGMGEVYLATDLALDRPVALKILPAAVAAAPELKERFLREARAQARVAHPNVCHIYFIGEEDELLFFAMEYIEGESLAEMLERDGPLPAADAVEYCRMAALGLREAAHHGFTHRDVKPSNLMVDRHGVLKVVDFGIAKQATGDAAITQEGSGALIGTPLYMAPEQARGEPVDFRADIYSLGATLHHLLTGAPPFSGDTPLAVVSRHLADPRPKLAPRMRSRRARGLDELCDRMMAKRPADRFDDYDALVTALDRVSPRRARPAGFWVRAFAVVLDLLVLALLLVPFEILFDVLGLAAAGFDDDVALLLIAPLYVIGCHAHWGRTIGQLALEIRLSPVDGTGRVGWKRAAIRFLAQFGWSYAALGAANLMSSLGAPDWTSVPLAMSAVLVPLVAGIAGAGWRADKRALWDRAAGTDVCYGERSRDDQPSATRAARARRA